MKFTLFIIAFLFLSSSSYAQLSQLDFEKEAKKSKQVSKSKEVKQKTVSNIKKENKASSKSEKLSFTGQAIMLNPINDLAFIPPSLKGVDADKKNENSITSDSSWPLPKSRDCSGGRSENSYLKRGVSLREVLKRFTGSHDYFDVSVENVCNEKCGANSDPLITNLKIDELSTGVFSVGIINNSCKYILEKSKGRDWKALKLLSLNCSCINSAKVKKALKSARKK